MNTPIRRLSRVVGLLFMALFVSTTLIQFVFARNLNARADNQRTILANYSRERGEILVGEKPVAISKPVDDQYKYQRSYPSGKVYAPITGFFSYYGAGNGLESSDDDYLSGASDRLFYRHVSDVVTGRRYSGASLETTIDAKVQQAGYEALGKQRGAAVALDPATGAILAMVSTPSYDPNSLASHDLKKVNRASKTLNESKVKPMLNRAINELYPPGSTFKVVTAAAALSSGDFTPDSELPGPAVLDLPQTTVGLPNHTGRACGPGDKVTMTVALRDSCNPAFGWLGMQVGADAMRDQADKFGFGEKIEIPMAVTPSSFPAELNEPQLAQSSIGQYDDLVSPMQMAMVAAGIANQGDVMKPYLVQAVVGSDLKEIETASPSTLTNAVSSPVAVQLREMMVGVVENGTGKAAQLPGIPVAGKTGTAEQGAGRAPHAWFISFAPADDPKIAVAVVVEDGGSAGEAGGGGLVAAPIARAMMDARLNSKDG